ncbi:hypothetical protein C8F04DRAFT_1141984 [Mycena alexandri]|uniref:Secreted protein n=1 Tax=Mycena alexandri TaxID=1745969 RepID=A0AAD6S5V8_9AGAR|nr:hypothetical protein C8F04DRAFT_1141984 [Mycena alexandri]
MHKLHVGWLRPSQAVWDPTILVLFRVAVVLAEGKEQVVGHSSLSRREVGGKSGGKSEWSRFMQSSLLPRRILNPKLTPTVRRSHPRLLSQTKCTRLRRKEGEHWCLRTLARLHPATSSAAWRGNLEVRVEIRE